MLANVTTYFCQHLPISSMQHCKEEAEGPVTYLADVDEALVAEAAVLLAAAALAGGRRGGGRLAVAGGVYNEEVRLALAGDCAEAAHGVGHPDDV